MRTNNYPKHDLMRAAMTLLVALFASASAWAQYVAIFADPNSAGMVQVGTDIELDSFSEGASFMIAEPGETIYFSYEPFSDYMFHGLRYTNLSSSDVTELPNNIYSFTMPNYPADEEFWVSVFVEFKKIPVVVTGVDINADNFPDEHFRTWLLSQSFGTDAVITDAEMATITKLSPRACGIEDLTGIHFFTELTELDISNNEELHPEENWNRISSINLSSNTKLRKIYINNNQFTSLDLSPCPELRTLNCSDNLLEELDVTSNPLLSVLSCDGNQLTGLDVSHNSSLSLLSCQRNQLTGLDVSQNLALEQLSCENNQLTSIDVTSHDKLIIFNCNNNQLTSLDLTGCTALFQLYCYNNQINGQAMEDLVNSLETPPNGGYMVVLDLESETEQNAITEEQIEAARAKTWSVEGIRGEDFERLGKVTHEYVDLGLTSGTLWATCNVGADWPEDPGLFFAWGDTEGHGDDVSDGYLFSWENYKWGEVMGDDTYFTKYCTDSSRGKDGFTDGKYELDPEDDAAYVNWGPQWRTPTHEMLEELRNECTWTATTLEGVKGYQVEGPNGNTIFLPETGWRLDDMLLDGGAYWSRSANPDDVGGAYYLGWDDYGMYEYGGRSDGQCVRPVVNNQCIQLADTTDNSTIIADNDGKTVDVALQGRTLYKDGSWNMLCLPFNISDSSVEGDLQSVEGDLQSPTFANTPLEGAVVMTLESASFANGTLTLNFASATSIAAGTPYIVRWEKADDYADDNDHNLYEPVFMGVTIHAAAPTDISADVITLHGCYSPASIEGEDKTILYLDAGNRLCYPKDAMSINALRGWFLLPEGLINPSLGDVNGDKAITIADVMMIVNNIMGKANDNFLIENADLNGDRQISVADVMALVSIVIGDNNSFDVVTNLDDAPLTFGGAATGPARAKKIKD